jgi:hypothetical protein
MVERPYGSLWKINQNPMLSQEYCRWADAKFGILGFRSDAPDRSCDTHPNLKTSRQAVSPTVSRIERSRPKRVGSWRGFADRWLRKLGGNRINIFAGKGIER